MSPVFLRPHPAVAHLCLVDGKATMGAARKDFVVVAMGAGDAGGYDERALALLVAVVDSTVPDARIHTSTGAVAFYLSSARGIAAAKDLVLQAETLRDRDPQFTSLGIGVSRGPLLADFDWRGRVKAGSTPLGETANRASAGAARHQDYREILEHLHETQTV